MDDIQKLKKDLEFERSRADMYKKAYDTGCDLVNWWSDRCRVKDNEIGKLRKEIYILKTELSDYKAGLK